MNRRGFTTIELIMVFAIIGIIAAFGFPKIRSAVIKSNVRSAKAAMGTMVVKAKAAAVSRGCNATLTVLSGTVAIAVCNVNGAGTQILGGVDSLAARFSVAMSPNTASLTFDPRGLTTNYASLVIGFSSTDGTIRDSVLINQLGQVMRQ